MSVSNYGRTIVQYLRKALGKCLERRQEGALDELLRATLSVQLADTLQKVGDHGEAISLLNGVLAIRKKYLEPSHFTVVEVLVRLAHSHALTGEPLLYAYKSHLYATYHSWRPCSGLVNACMCIGRRFIIFVIVGCDFVNQGSKIRP